MTALIVGLYFRFDKTKSAYDGYSCPQNGALSTLEDDIE